MPNVEHIDHGERARKLVASALKNFDHVKLEDLLFVLRYASMVRYYDDNVVKLFGKTLSRFSGEVLRVARENTCGALKLLKAFAKKLGEIEDYLVLFEKRELAELFLDNLIKIIFRYPDGFLIEPGHIEYLERKILTLTLDENETFPAKEVGDLVFELVKKNITGEIFDDAVVKVHIIAEHKPNKDVIKNIPTFAHAIFEYEIRYESKDERFPTVRIPLKIHYIKRSDSWTLKVIKVDYSPFNFAYYDSKHRGNQTIEDVIMSQVQYNVIYFPSLIAKLVREANKRLNGETVHKLRFRGVSAKTGDDVVSSLEKRFTTVVSGDNEVIDVRAEPIMFRRLEFTAKKFLPKIIVGNYTIIFKARALRQLFRLLPREVKEIYKRLRKVGTIEEFDSLKQEFSRALREHLASRDIYLGLSKDRSFATTKTLWCYRVVTEKYTPIPHKVLFDAIDSYLSTSGRRYDSWRVKFYRRVGKIYVLRDALVEVVYGVPVYFSFLITNSDTGDRAIHITPGIVFRDYRYNFVPIGQTQVVVHRGEPAEILARIIEKIKQMRGVEPKYRILVRKLWNVVPETVLRNVIDELLSMLPRKYSRWLETYRRRKRVRYKELVTLINSLISKTRSKEYSLRLLLVIKKLFHEHS